MANPSKQKGTSAETALRAWLWDNGHADAVRNPPGGAKDVGDLRCMVDGRDDWTRAEPCVIEVKNVRNLAVAIREGLAELDAEMVNAGAAHGVLVVKPHGVGLTRAGDWYAIRRVANDPEIGVVA